MRFRWLSLGLLACGCSIATGWAATPALDRSSQIVVVLTDDWASSTAVLHSFERGGIADDWKKRSPSFPVVVGKNGLGQGRGLIRLNFGKAPGKTEGDERAPAGIFRLSTVFGYAPARSASWVKLPYLELSQRIEGVDDPRSRYYNKLVDRSKVAKVDWHSSEQMRRDDVLYKWGVVVDHNPAAIPGAGSCIFLHVWKSPSSSTAGCTAMRERDLTGLIRWLDPTRHPILVQMPRAIYRALWTKYNLPPDHS